MSQIINNLKVFGDFDPKLRQIKCCFVGKTAYCVLNDNKVYVLGEYIHYIFGYYDRNEKYVLIKELCNQNIEEFYEGDGGFTMFARSETNEIFCWEENTRKIRIPHKIDFLDNKDIINISCDNTHCLALSSNGLVYECKHMGQLGDRGWNGYMAPEFIPRNIFKNTDLKTKVKNISINSLHEINSIWVETFNSEVREYIKDQGRWSEGLNCNLKEVQKLIQNKFKGENNKIIDFCFDRNYQTICETKSCVYVFSTKDSKVTKTNYKTIFEYFLLSFEATYKTIHFEDNKYYTYNIEITKDNSKQLVNIRKEYDLTEYCCGQNETNIFLRKFIYSKDLLQISDSIIKYYYQLVWDGFYVVNDKDGNKVYCLGRNSNGILGLGHRNRIYEPTEIIELRNENIEDFYASSDCMFARNDKNEIFFWGSNQYGQLARGFKSDYLDCLKPDKIDFKGKQIIDISTGKYHSLALTSEGCVYIWGKNYLREN